MTCLEFQKSGYKFLYKWDLQDSAKQLMTAKAVAAAFTAQRSLVYFQFENKLEVSRLLTNEV